MPITVTWTEDGKPPVIFTINDTAKASLESYRLSMTIPVIQTVVDTAGNSSTAYVPAPIDPDLISMIMRTLTQCVIIPAFRAFPSLDIQTAAAAAKSAVDALAAAEAAFIQGSLSVAPPPVTPPV